MIAFYFGKLPNYFDVWLKGIEGNPDYDFIFFTDNKETYEYPSNMQVHYCSFDFIREKTQKHFNFDISLNKPYKFTDFKPAFGVIFKDELKDYDFWGYVDQDVILGNINKFITSNILDAYDRILSRDHLSIYRNTEEVSLRFKTISKQHGKLYKKVYTSPNIFCFGERSPHGTYHIWNENNWKIYTDEITADIDYTKYYFKVKETLGFEETQSKQQLFCMSLNNGQSTLNQYSAKNGRVYEREFLYIHLQKRNMSVERKNTNQDDVNFLILPDRFVEFEGVNPKLVDESFIRTHLGRINPLNDHLKLYERAKIKAMRFFKQLKY